MSRGRGKRDLIPSSNGHGKHADIPIIGERAPFNILVGLTAQDMCRTHFAHDLAMMMAFNGVVVNMTQGAFPLAACGLFTSEGTLIAPQRRDIAKVALDQGRTHILWLDTDMRFPKDTLIRLLGHNKPIVAANYCSRRVRNQLKMVAFKEYDPKGKAPPTICYTSDDKSGLEPVRSVGMGVMLTSTEVFKNTPYPWFKVDYHEGQGFEGEDNYFCRLAREAGYEILIDHDLSREVVHLGSWDYRHDHANTHREAELEQQAAEAAAASALVEVGT